MPSSTRSVRILLTASEAYPALEKAFLAAQSEIWASFPVFDLTTPLRSPEALAIGRTWFDLIVHTLNRDVTLHICTSDVDPIARPDMHRAATQRLRWFSAAAGAANPGAKLHVVRARHPAQTGVMIRLAIWPFIMRKLFKTAGWLNGLPPDHRAAALRDMDGFSRTLRSRPDGTVAVRLFTLPVLYPALHHQKLAVIDRRLLYIGGLDIDEHRFDTPALQRTADQTWHDVQLMFEGPIVAEAQKHLETFRDVVGGRLPPPRTSRLLRTLSRPRPRNFFHLGPEPLVSELRTTHLVLAQRATSFIYLESQYFRDQKLATALASRAQHNPDLQMILMLPAASDEAAFEGRRGLGVRLGEAMQSRALGMVRKAFGPRLFVGSPAQPRLAASGDAANSAAAHDQHSGAPLIYGHAKVSVFDDTAAIVSSGNLNGRSMRWDTEAGVHLTLKNDVVELRHRVMAHWLPANAGNDAFDAHTAVRAWARLAWRNASVPPAQRAGHLLPHDFAVAEAFGRKLPTRPTQFG